MVAITALNGTVLHLDDNSVAIVSGPRPSDPPDRTYVVGAAAATIETAEDAATLVARLHPKKPLVRLTRPDGSPVWIAGPAVTAVEAPSPDDIPPGEKVGAVVVVAGHHQAVVESVASVQGAIDLSGGNV